VAFHGEPVPRTLVGTKSRYPPVEEQGVDSGIACFPMYGNETDSEHPDALVMCDDSVTCFMIG